MKIGLDFDGVFCDASKLLIDGAKKLFGIDLPQQKTTCKDVFGEDLLSKTEFDFLKNFAFEDPDSGLQLKPVFGVVSACRTLLNRGHELQIITKRNQGVSMAQDFCKRLGLKIPIIGSKTDQPKSSLTRGLDVFLDDSIGVLEELQTAVPNRFLFLWDYNQDNNFSEDKKVISWLDFVQKID